MSEAVIVSAKRTAVGTFNGGLSSFSAQEMGSEVIKAALADAKVAPADVEEVIFGQVLVAGGGQNPVRQAALKAGLPHESTAFGVSQVCGSGLRAVALAAQAIKAGDANLLVAGGQESMSRAMHGLVLRKGVKMGNATMVDTMINDGLWCAFNDYHMGMTAENIAAKWNISREEVDAFALGSQQKAAAAQKSGRFADEIVPMTVKSRKGDKVIDQDEFIRPETTAEGLAKLRPAFKKDGGVVTAGNASGINDGAAALVIMSAEEAEKRGLKPLARIVSSAVAGVDPAIMGTGPIPATQKALKKAGWTVDDLDLVEANEAFASQAIACVRDLKLDPAKVNVNGGAIAIGHPIGASGARILVTLLHEMVKRDSKKGLATLCIGGGMGCAVCVERA